MKILAKLLPKVVTSGCRLIVYSFLCRDVSTGLTGCIFHLVVKQLTHTEENGYRDVIMLRFFLHSIMITKPNFTNLGTEGSLQL